MAQTFRTRSALSEIPIRMGLLRVSTDELNFPVLHPTIIDSPINNIPLSYLSPAPSPDELVIRQRGRRRISLTWSPEKAPNVVMRTPTKAATTTMTLRSSPRKRLLLQDFTPLTPEKLISPRKINQTSSRSWYPSNKRLRFEDKPMAQTNLNTPLNTILKGLNSVQLLGIIQNLVNDKPELEQKIRAELPMPDIKPIEEQLNLVKKNIFKSLPASRLVKKTDSTGYARAVTHLNAFKKTVVDQSRLYYDSQHWDALLDYAMMAWNYVKATPIWDNHSHNATRRHCFKILVYHCSASLKYGGILLGEQRLNEFAARVNQMATDCEDILSSLKPLNNLLMSLHSHHTSVSQINNNIN